MKALFHKIKCFFNRFLHNPINFMSKVLLPVSFGNSNCLNNSNIRLQRWIVYIQG